MTKYCLSRILIKKLYWDMKSSSAGRTCLLDSRVLKDGTVVLYLKGELERSIMLRENAGRR